MTSRPDTFRIAATLLLGDVGARPLPLRHALTADPLEPPVVLEWQEFDRVQLVLESPDEEAVLELEGYDQPIPAGTRRTIPLLSDTALDAYPWYPGDYELWVTVGGTTWHGLFRVRPRHLDVDQLAQLRQDLERVVAGLTLDVTLRRGYHGAAASDLQTAGVDRVRLRQLSLLQQAARAVSPALAHIAQEPQRRLGREYAVVDWHRSQRLDGKSFRWLARGEWLRDPRAIPDAGWNRVPRAVLAPMPSQSHDTYENRVVRFVLQALLARARTLGRALETDLQAVQREAAEAESRGWNASLVREQEAGYRRLQPVVADVEKELAGLLATPFLSEVGTLSGAPSPTTTLLKDGRYRTLFRWYQQVEEALVTVDTGEQFQMRTKRTATLYEYWCLFRTIELLGELGFQLTDGDLGLRLREANRERLIPVIEPGSVFWLQDGRGRRLRVAYDQVLPVTQDEALERGFDVYIANQRNRPDIRIDLMAGAEPVRCLVLDAKYRRLSAIWNRSHNEVIYQLLSYAGNLYYVRRPRVPLTQVAVALYPGAGGDPAWQTREDGGIALARMAPYRPTEELKRCFERFVGDALAE